MSKPFSPFYGEDKRAVAAASKGWPDGCPETELARPEGSDAVDIVCAHMGDGVARRRGLDEGITDKLQLVPFPYSEGSLVLRILEDLSVSILDQVWDEHGERSNCERSAE